ncbi:Protein kinase dsk1 [Gracilariopsis chorda]|uniref:non-specific serine/threonine protein kinase n=1 Tax=Gracilariopsis chorda TaxID=448386 RepID=A0A2V3IMP7_9FLOR|nr:Protein kinase dsk1 [Gracilariopsis chorda]|eukprot:PXF43327.1 Protein kinase dsk1 [Gracilariopsis chorda]
MGTAVEKRERPHVAMKPAVEFPYHEDSDSSLGEQTEKECLKQGGYHPVKVGDTFKNGTYRALCRLGVGHFSTVWLCLDNNRFAGEGSSDNRRNRVVALKIQKSATDYTEAAKDEIKLLQAVRKKDRYGRAPVISLLDHFEHFGPNGRHVCLVFDVLGNSLLKLIRRFNYRGAPLSLVRRISKDILEGLHFLHSEAGIIHTDLKPENVLFEVPSHMMHEVEAKSATYNEHLCEIRRREIMNGSTASESSDVSSGMRPATRAHRRNQKKRLKAKAKRTTEREAASFQPPHGRPSARPQSFVAAQSTRPITADDGLKFDNRSPPSLSPRAQSNGTTFEKFELGSIVDKDEMFARGVVKIADLGNACWINKHFTEDIQTRQYRSPEVILGVKYNRSVDIWSAACLIFELLTGDYLFDPHSSLEYDRDEDHLALMVELLGPMPRYLTRKGEFSRELFTRNGELRHIKNLDSFPLIEVLEEKYKFDRADAALITSFLEPMLCLDPEKRMSAKECLAHPFLQEIEIEPVEIAET